VSITALEHRSLAEAARQSFADQMVGARVHRAAHLGAEPAVRDAHAALDQAMVEPGRAGRLDLRRQVEVRSRCEDQVGFGSPGLPTARSSTMPPSLGCAPAPRCREADMMRAAVRAVDHGIGRAGQLVVQPLVDQPADDRLLGRAAENRIAVERSVLPAILERVADRADDVAARGQLAQLRLRASATAHWPGSPSAASPIVSRCCKRPTIRRRSRGSSGPGRSGAGR
jgi:hypothetical protein